MTRIQARVARKWPVARDIAAFELEAVTSPLPPPEAGAHIDIHLPGGLIRQYSLTNGPDERGTYVIAVKREPQSRGGSEAMHARIGPGDIVEISPPRNNFALAPAAASSLLIAGGIGLTPLLAMAKQLDHAGGDFALHCFARSAEDLAFSEIVGSFGPRASRHLGLDGDATLAVVRDLLTPCRAGTHLYVCGPPAMLRAVVAEASNLGWADGAVHYEYFSNDAAPATEGFSVRLGRSGREFAVPPDRSLLDVLRDQGVEIESSCEQGVCGTCLTGVLEGEPEHHDVYLTREEQESGSCILPCVSRAKSSRLVLDL